MASTRESMQALLRALADRDWLVRRTAAESLGQTKSGLAVEPLTSTLLCDDNSIVRILAAYALGEIGDFRAVDALVTALNKDEHSGVREAAAKMLGKWKHPETVRWLIHSLRSEQPWGVRDRAAAALVDIGTTAVESLIACLTASDLYTKRNAIWALGTIGDTRAVEPLIAVLGEKE